MKFLFLGLNYAPEPVGIGPYTTGLAEALAARGHEVTVVCSKPYYPQWRLYPGFEGWQDPSMERGVSVVRVPHYIPENPSGPRRIAHHLSFALSANGPMMRAAKAGPDLVFTVAPSLLAVPVAWRVARKAEAPLWLHVQDFEVEASFATGLLDRRSMPGRLALTLEDRILGMADVVSTISPQMRAKLVEKGIPAKRTFELRNWSTAEFVNVAEDEAAYRREWNIGERHIALYSGNIANKQGLDVILESARRLASRDDILFLICGEGPNRAALEQVASGLKNVQFRDLQPARRMGGFLSLASVHLLPQIVGAADLVLPSKLTNMLASGKPVIATAMPGTGLHAEVEECGIATTPGDAALLTNAITTLIDNPGMRAAMGEEARRRAVARWSRAAIINEMELRAEKLLWERRRL